MGRRVRAGVAGCLALVLAGGYLSLGGSEPAEAIEPREAAEQLFAITNIDRTSNGLPALPRDNRLSTVGVARSQDMIDRDYFAHEIPPDGLTVLDVLESLGVPFRAAGENIAWNNAVDFTTVQTAGEDFMNSPSHRANLLDERWDRMGAGVAEGGGKKMYAVLFMQSLPAEGGAVTPGGPGVAREPAVPRVHGERVELAGVKTGLLTTLVNSMVRLFLNLQ